MWIAFNYWYLWYSEQLTVPWLLVPWSCELLSIIGIFDILNNFAFTYSGKNLLWIAFNYWYLWYSEQRPVRLSPARLSCELLSIIGIFDILNNNCMLNRSSFIVVNCFQLLVSLIFWTTTRCRDYAWCWLWIAFNYWYLWYSEQLSDENNLSRTCCELLSIIGIFDILNNQESTRNPKKRVVNCFQLLVSLIFWTTLKEPIPPGPCCELLSIIGIFDILNNPCFVTHPNRRVVNCFQLLVSLIFWTTVRWWVHIVL